VSINKNIKTEDWCNWLACSWHAPDVLLNYRCTVSVSLWFFFGDTKNLIEDGPTWPDAA